jgi:hypothetical protein
VEPGVKAVIVALSKILMIDVLTGAVVEAISEGVGLKPSPVAPVPVNGAVIPRAVPPVVL